MHVVVPYDATAPKTRLSPLLAEPERCRVARAMLDDVLTAITGAGGDPHVLATEPVSLSVPVTVDDRPLSTAVNERLADSDRPTAIVMADLALATPVALTRLFDADGPVVLVPGRGGGTNALLVRDDRFAVDFHGLSYRDHRRTLDRLNVTPTIVDSYRLGTDIDEPDDLPEVFVHSDGTTRETLTDLGFSLSVGEGRVTLERGGQAVVP